MRKLRSDDPSARQLRSVGAPPAETRGSNDDTIVGADSDSLPSADSGVLSGTENAHWLNAILEAAPLAIVVEDAQGRVRCWNPEAERQFGWQAADLVGRMVPFGPDADRVKAERRLQRALDGERVHEAEIDCIRQDGTRVAASVLVVPLVGRDGRVFGVLSMYADINERKRAEHHMILQAMVMRVLAESESAGGSVTRVLQVFCGLSGWVCGLHWVLDPTDGALQSEETWHLPGDALLERFVAARAAVRISAQETHVLARRALAKAVWVGDIAQETDARSWEDHPAALLRSAFAFPVSVDGEVLGAIELLARGPMNVDQDLLRMAAQLGALIGQHISRRETERRLQFVVSHDPLTGLPNRAIFNQRLGQALAQAARYDHKLALLFVDLDRFKIVNDTMGHEAGDRLLREVADRLRESLREGDTVGRQGGDEFVVLIEHYESAMQVAGVAQKIIDQTALPYYFDGHEFNISASIGIATYPNDGQDGATLLKHADIAMYRAKEAGKNQYQFYSPHMNRLSSERIELETALRHALERGEFTLLYQPKFDMEGRTIVGMEALLRWQRPGIGLLPPGDFLALAEETGLAVHIGEWVLRTACAQARMWQDRGSSPVRVSVNISPRHFAHGNLVGCVEDVLRATRLPASALEVEITESMVLQNVERAGKVLRELKELGVTIAVDDFGTGVSSLGYLTRFPLDTVKVDRSFISVIPKGGQGVGVTRAVIAMAHSLGLKAVAEGVETDEQARFLRIQGCNEMQGFLFSAPLAPDEALALLEGGTSPPESRQA